MLVMIWHILLILLPSPSGKLVQIEYALQAVAAGSPSVGIKGEWGRALCEGASYVGCALCEGVSYVRVCLM